MYNYRLFFEDSHKKRNSFLLVKFMNQNSELSRWLGIFDDIIIDNSLSQGIVREGRAVDFCCNGEFFKINKVYLFEKADENVINSSDDDDEPKEKKQKF